MSRLVSLRGGRLPGHRACAFVLCFCVMCIALFYIVCISMVVGVERAFAMSDLFYNPLSAVVFSYVFNVRAFGKPNSFPNSLSAVALCITRDFGKLNYVLFWFPSAPTRNFGK